MHHEKVRQLCTAEVPLIILGPGFAKETLVTEGKNKAPELFGRAHIFHTGQAGMAGIHELMKKGIGAEVLRGSRVAEETEEVERVLEEIAKRFGQAFSAPFVREMAGRVQMIVPAATVVTSYDPKDGRPLWTADGPSKEFIATPVYNEKAGLLLCGTVPFSC